MKSWWLTFSDSSHACCQGESEYDAKRIAEKMAAKTAAGDPLSPRKVIAAQPLPYPASPVIWQFDHPVTGKTPAFCYEPDKCAGRSSCPQCRSCAE